MKKRVKIIIKRILLVFLITTALFVSLILNRDYLKIESNIKDILSTIPKIFVDTTKEINQTESYIIQKNINSSLEKEIKELKKLLDLNSTLTEYGIVNATVISRNNMYWFNTLTIDKGKKSGIKKDMAVITTEGLIGKVSKVSNKTSEIKLITADDITYKTSVVIKINEKDYYAILNGYDKNNNLLKLTGIDKSVKLEKGAIVLTSGLGLMPEGIYIGTVENETLDTYNLSKIVSVKSSQDFNNINYVTILKEPK